ncbi:unnamed protein product [Polarella glacialis]|uniref:Uncharacterized protein n=1 Tax=Polarella glacialis TaxID=89957 RepID=A0A813KAI5_POLGL|nr:unnamed protein product [Polarella glacialis]
MGDLTPDCPAPLEAVGWRDPILAQLPDLERELTAAERARLLSQPEYWAALCPALHVGDPEMARLAADSVLDVDPDLVDECRERMLLDGYFNIDAAFTPEEPESGRSLDWAVDVAALADGVKRLTEAGWPASFLLMYDEPWIMAHQLKNFMLMTTGNRLIMDFSFFHVGGGRSASGATEVTAGAKSSRGWPPHRDRGTDEAAAAFRTDGTPKYSTTWIPLTDATTTNSCLYAVSQRHDPGYFAGDFGKNPLQAVFCKPEAFQHIKALPCPAGSLVHFSHRLIHWGSAADEDWQRRRSEGPRIALSFACADESFERPYLVARSSPLPPVNIRASLISGLALAYLQNEEPGDFRSKLYWDVFQQNLAAFDRKFVGIVSDNYKAYSDRERGQSSTGEV